MKVLISASLLIFLVACASEKKLLKVTGLDRVEIDQTNYKKPEFFIGDFKHNVVEPEKEIARKPASADIVYPEVQKEGEDKLSNRQIYFLSFYKQYKLMSKILNVKPKINSCPSFHNIILDNKGLDTADIGNYTTQIDFTKAKMDQRNLSFYPILAIPYSDRQDLYSVLMENNWENGEYHVKAALTHYFKTSELEIQSLCDKGISAGYYIFENLVTYFKKQRNFHGTKSGLKALLKVPVLANMIILDNLNQKNHLFAETQVYDKWLLKRTNAKWFGKFLKDLKMKRESRVSSNFIK